MTSPANDHFIWDKYLLIVLLKLFILHVKKRKTLHKFQMFKDELDGDLFF